MSFINELKNYRDEILKAEIVSYLALWNKVNPNKGPNRFEKNINIQNLHKKISNLNIKILDKNFNAWNDFLNNWRGWRKKSSADDLLQVLYGISESLNSGIDKGSPKNDNKVKPENQKWISNAFGSYKNGIIYLSKSESEINAVVGEIENSLDRVLSNVDYESYVEFMENLKSFFSNLLSDDRYPINDVTLWDQAYMATSMFKASLANYVLNNSNIGSTLPDRTSIKWRILGIQYDKLGLAEKGFKPAHIKWYREVSKEIDEEIKRLLEYEYPIGNEVYRDETGIYFIVGEDLGEDLSNENLAKLKDDLSGIKDKILEIFKEKSLDEFYPAIFLTKASRGLMNLTYLLEKAKENFLKADWSKKDLDVCLEKSLNGRAMGICQVCKQRLVFESDKRDENKNICKTCYEEKTQGRVDEWLNNRNNETIWTTELKDKNERIALVVMKFELMDWLSGDLLSSEILNQLKILNLNYKAGFSKMNETLNTIKELSLINAFDINEYRKNKSSLNDFLLKINSLISNVGSSLDGRYGLELDNAKKTFVLKDKEGVQQNLVNILQNKKFENFIKIFDFEIFNILSPDAYNGCKSNNESFNDYIKQIFFGSIIGTEWEKFVTKHNINSKINWQEETIDWTSLDENDINFLSTLILQFLLRKNPSPARLRRIWESTKEFFEEIEKNLLCIANIPDERRKRLYWKNVNIPDGEYYDGDALFWAKDKTIYLITYLKDKSKESFKLKRNEDGTDTEVKLQMDNAKVESYKPYLSIIDPTPISWQFIIPAEYVPDLIKNIQNLYDEYFKYVYGKLPLHIGVVIQDYKKPLYVGINALRKIRRDVINRKKLWVEIEAKEFKAMFNEKLKKEKIEEQCNNPQDYYSLYFGNLTNGEYQFYVVPKDNPTWISSIGKIPDNAKIKYIPNTFDFEFLDTNARRNDIYYDENKNYRRTLELKNNRPYDIEKYLELFLNFREVFSASTSKSKLNNLISLFYDKLESFDADTSLFLASAIINILEPHKNPKIAEFVKKWLEVDDLSHLKMKDKINQEKIKLFLDMYEFWHKALKEV